MKLYKTLLTVVSLTVLVVSVLFGFAFRRVEISGAAQGTFFLKYRWGKPSELLLDANRDGTIDSRRILDTNAGDFAPGTFLESYESSYCNGVFDIHTVFKGESVRMIEYDSDSDGNFDQVFHGSDAVLIQEQRPDLCQGLQVNETPGQEHRSR